MNRLLIASRGRLPPLLPEGEGAPGPCKGPNPGSTPLDPSVPCASVGSSPLASFLTAVDAKSSVGALRGAGRGGYSGAAACPPARSSKSHNPAPHVLPPGTRPYLGADPPPVEEMVVSGGTPDFSLTPLPEGGATADFWLPPFPYGGVTVHPKLA